MIQVSMFKKLFLWYDMSHYSHITNKNVVNINYCVFIIDPNEQLNLLESLEFVCVLV